MVSKEVVDNYTNKFYERHLRSDIRRMLEEFAAEVLKSHTVLMDTFDAVNVLEGRTIAFKDDVHVRLYTAEEFMKDCNDSCVAAGMPPNMTIEKARELTKRLMV